jgi:hypothetical protein
MTVNGIPPKLFSLHYAVNAKNVILSLQQDVETHRVVRHRRLPHLVDRCSLTWGKRIPGVREDILGGERKHRNSLMLEPALILAED